MRVAQRELKVKVTADIDRSLTKLLDSLKKKTTYNIKINVKQDSLNKAKKTLDSLSKKSTIKVKTNVNSKSLTKLNDDLEKIGKSKIVAGVDVKVQDGGLGQLQKELNEAERKAEEVSNARISPTGVAAGLAPLLATLDQISDKILNIANQTIAPIVKDTWSDSMDLFDTQKSFEVQMKGLGMADEQLNQIIKDMNAYGKQSKYSIAQMLNAYSEFKGAGDEDPAKLIKGMAGLASYGKNPNQGFNALLTNLTEGANTDSLYTGDWRQIRKAIGASASKSLRDWFKVNKGIELTKDNLSKGMITVGDFKEAIEAVGNGDTFQKMATQTNTLRSAYDNLKESLTSAMIGDLDNKGPLAKLGETLVKQINDFSEATPMIAKQISQGLDYVFDVFGKNLKDFNAKDFLKDFANSFKSSKPTIDAAAKLLGILTNNGKDLGKVTGNLIELAAGWKLFRGLSKPVLSLASAGGTLLKVAQSFNLLKFKDGGFFSKLFGAFGAKGGKKKTYNFKQIKAQALNMAKNLATVAGVIGTVWVSAKAFESISKMDIDFSSLAQNLGAVALGLTAAGGYISAIGLAMDRMASLQQYLITGSIALTGVAGVMLVVSKAVEKISAMKIDVSSLTKNLTATLLGLTASTAVISAIGGAMVAFPPLIPALTAGSIAFVAISAVLKSISNNFSKTSGDLVIFAENIKKFNAIKLPDAKTLTDKLGTVKAVVNGMSNALGNGGFWKSLVKKFTSGFNAKSTENLVSQITSIFSIVDKINKTPKISAEGVKEKLNNVTKAMKALNAVEMDGFEGLPADSLAKAINAVNSIKSIGDTFKKLPKKLDYSSIQASINEITNILTQPSMTNYRNALQNMSMGDVDVKSAKSIINSLTTVANTLRELPGDIDFTTTGTAIQQLTEQIKKLGDDGKDGYGFKQAIQKLGKGKVDVSGAVDLVNSINTIAGVLRELPADINFDTTGTAITKITETVRSLATSQKDGGMGFKQAIQSLGKGKVDVTGAVDLVTAINTIAGVLRSVPADINFDATVDTINKITNTVSKLATSQDKDGIGFKQAVQMLGKGKPNIEGAMGLINAITTIANSLIAIPVYDPTVVDTAIGSITKTLNALTAEDGIKSAIIKLTKDDLPSKIQQANSSISTISTLANTLNALPEVSGVEAKMKAIASGINEIAGLKLNPDTLKQVDNIVFKVQNIISQLQLLNANFTSIGTTYANNLVQGFSANINSLYTKFKDTKDKITNNADLTATGTKMSTTLANGFNADGIIQKINSIQSAIDSLKGKTVDININTNYNDFFNTSGKKGKKGEGHSFNGGIIPEYHSDGGRVGMRPKGSLPWYTGSRRQRNTDSVPTMLTPGEYVLKRSVSNALGKGFLDALNNMNLSSAMARLQNKVNGGYTDQRVTNNYITQNVDNKASYLNGLGTIRRTVRL